MSLTHKEHETILSAFAEGEEERRKVSEFIAGASFPPGTAELRLTDPETGERTGQVAAGIVVERNADPALAELFRLRAELTHEAFIEQYSVRPQWASCIGRQRERALVRLELMVRSPVPSVHRFLLLPDPNRGALTLATQGELVLLVPLDIALQSERLGAYQVLGDALPVGQAFGNQVASVKASLALTESDIQRRPNRRERRAAARGSRR
jgi:hypothetical protein